MFKFSRASKAKPDSQFAETTMVTAGGSTVAAGGFQRDLIYVSFKDTLRVYGVPAEWLDCLVITYPDREGNERVQIQLVMRKWSGHLMRYAMALEHQLVQCLCWAICSFAVASLTVGVLKRPCLPTPPACMAESVPIWSKKAL